MTEGKAQEPEDKPARKKGFRRYWDNPWLMVILAALLLWTGRHFDNSPQRAEHQLLVATAKVRGDVFDHAVIFVLQHRHSGAAGVILNRPEKNGPTPHDYTGGPMEPEKLVALHSLDVTLPDTVAMRDAGFGVLVGKKAVETLEKAEKKPKWYRIYHGYAGWGPHQLDSELHDGEWELVECDGAKLMDTPDAKLWDTAHAMPMLK